MLGAHWNGDDFGLLIHTQCGLFKVLSRNRLLFFIHTFNKKLLHTLWWYIQLAILCTFVIFVWCKWNNLILGSVVDICMYIPCFIFLMVTSGNYWSLQPMVKMYTWKMTSGATSLSCILTKVPPKRGTSSVLFIILW